MATYRVFLDGGDDVKLDDPEPSGYCEWNEWAKLQMKAGRIQAKCIKCSRFYWVHLKKCNRCGKEYE